MLCRLAVDTSKKEINELKCQERKMLRQTELIKSALNELGCEEVPSGCDLSIDNQPFITNSSEQVTITNLRKLTYDNCFMMGQKKILSIKLYKK